MKGDQIGTLTAHPSLQELSLSNRTWFSRGRLASTATKAKPAPESRATHGGPKPLSNRTTRIVSIGSSELPSVAEKQNSHMIAAPSMANASAVATARGSAASGVGLAYTGSSDDPNRTIAAP